MMGVPTNQKFLIINQICVKEIDCEGIIVFRVILKIIFRLQEAQARGKFLATGLLPCKPRLLGGLRGSYLKQIFSFPGCEALPNGRTPAL
jgi:hypothetical protein